MVGLRHARSEQTLWLTADHRVLAKLRPRSLGGQRDWSGVPRDHRQYRRQLRREMTATERLLWSNSRNKGNGFKFRRQHPIGPYIADFYCREAHLVVEVDGESHFTHEARAYDMKRDEYMHALGLEILRFTTQDVRQNLPGVLLAIENQCRLRVESVDGAAWIQAGNLLPGDIVFFGTEREAVPLEEVPTICIEEEEVYDLEVEGAHSFVTEVCAVHNCGSGSTAYCAEKREGRWLACPTSRVAVAIARQRLMTAKFDCYELKDRRARPGRWVRLPDQPAHHPGVDRQELEDRRDHGKVPSRRSRPLPTSSMRRSAPSSRSGRYPALGGLRSDECSRRTREAPATSA